MPMNILAHKCLERFHIKYTDDSRKKVTGIAAFKDLLQNDYSAENLLAKVIHTDEHWKQMIEQKGLGLAKALKLEQYRSLLLKNWKTIRSAFESQSESAISIQMGFYLWDLDESEFMHSYLGVIQEAVLKNRLLRNNIKREIFCSFLGFIEQVPKTIDQIAIEYDIERERVRQLKVECIKNFENDFWFLKDNLIKNRLEELFDLDKRLPEEIKAQTARVNATEHVNFSSEFYLMVLSISCDMVLIGNINDVRSLKSRTVSGNAWTNLYLQTKKENERCCLDKLVNVLADEMRSRNYRFERDIIIPISEIAQIPLNEKEVAFYGRVIELELKSETKLQLDSAVIKRNTHVTLPELIEQALLEIGGYAYADEILDKLAQDSTDRAWTMQSLRTNINRVHNIYSVGKNGLFGLVYVKDVRADIGSVTLNDILRIYLSRKDSPIHVYELLVHVNTLFPRPKNLNTVYTILLQDSKAYFTKLSGEFYGLRDKKYEKFDYSEVTSMQGKELIRIIKNADGIRFSEFSEILSQKYGLLQIQVKYLMHLVSRTHNISLEDDKYYIRKKQIQQTAKNTENQSSEDEFNIEINQEELDYEELNQHDVPDDLRENLMAQIQIRRGQPKFRLKLLKLYNSTCIITGCKIPALLEAAHILPHAITEDFSASNGLLLRADIHTLFDLSLMAIDPSDMLLNLNPVLLDSDEYARLADLNIGQKLQKLHSSYQLNKEGLKYRWESFIAELD